MAKRPSFQFYPADWRKDAALQMCSMSTQGIWINLLCCMWEAEERGKITGTKAGFCRLLGCSEAEFENFLTENEAQKFADVTVCNKKIQDCNAQSNANVTLINRRMFKEEKQRSQTKKRVYEHRSSKQKSHCNANVTQKKDDCNADVQPSRARSSSSSSSTSVLNNNNSKPPSVTNSLQKPEAKPVQPDFQIEDETQEVIEIWNSFAKHKVEGCAYDAVAMQLAHLLLSPVQPIRLKVLKQAIANYREAITAKGTKAKHWTLGRWLESGHKNYLPGRYNLDNYVWQEEQAKKPKKIEV